MFGETIKKLREAKGITQKDMAEVLGVSRQAICMWEANKRELKASTLRKIARILDVSVDELVIPHSDVGIEKEVVMVIKSQNKKVTFSLNAPKASKVMLVGDFTSWDKNSIAMRKDKDGTWRTDIALRPGKYEYKFIVDGQWWTDPLNRTVTANTYGSQNSILEIATR